MKPQLKLVACILFTLVGSGCGDEGVEAKLKGLARAQCDLAIRCANAGVTFDGQFLEAREDPAGCVAKQTAALSTQLLDAIVERKTVALNEAGLRACKQALAADVCLDPYSDYYPECESQHLLTGLVPLDEICRDDVECAGDAYCAGASLYKACPGVCTPRAAVGEPCGSSAGSPECTLGDGTRRIECISFGDASGFVCRATERFVSGMAVNHVGPGESCGFQTDDPNSKGRSYRACPAGHFCAPDVVDEVCTPQRQAGEACSRTVISDECVDGTICTRVWSDELKAVCLPARLVNQAGEACTIGVGSEELPQALCNSLLGLHCDDGVCSDAPGAADAPCSADADCADGLSCNAYDAGYAIYAGIGAALGSRCTAPGELGTPCSKNRECSSKRCADGICVDATCEILD